jgi:hypothetical protein
VSLALFDAAKRLEKQGDAAAVEKAQALYAEVAELEPINALVRIQLAGTYEREGS